MKRFVVGMLCMGMSVVQAAPGYRYVVTATQVTPLLTLGGPQAEATDINDLGHVVGWSLNAAGVKRAFLYRDGVLIDITSPFGAASEAHGINNLSEVVGFWYEGSRPNAFRYSSSGLVNLADEDSPPRDIPSGSRAVAISDNGLIAGEHVHSYRWVGRLFSYSNATLWRDEYNFTTLASHYDWSSRTTDVNSLGMVIGYDSNVSHNFRKQIVDGVLVDGAAIPLVPDGTDFRYDEGAARALNEFGHVVGYVIRRETGATSSRRRAFQWSGMSVDAAYDLGVLPSGTESAAEDINDGGFIVGYANETVFPPPTFALTMRYRGFLYHPHFGLYALPAITGSGNCRATAASERAASGLIRIVGYCDLASGTRAVRWDVTVSRVTPPSTTP